MVERLFEGLVDGITVGRYDARLVGLVKVDGMFKRIVDEGN